MNAITPFLFDGEELVRVVDHGKDPWFVAADVCKCLEIGNVAQSVSNLDEDEKGICLTYTLGGTQELLSVPEGGLYTMMLRSRKAVTPGTKQHRFRKWVTSEVIPSIRKTGGYGKRSFDLRAPETAARLMTRLEKTTTPAIRRTLHAALDTICQEMGIQTPALDEIGRDAPTTPDILTSFFVELDRLGSQGVAYNHAHNSNFLAINMPEIKKRFAEYGIKFHVGAPLFDALKSSTNPVFVEAKSVNSAITGRSKRCWVFRRS